MDLATTVRRAESQHGLAVFLPAFLDGKDGAAASTLVEALPGIGFTGVAIDPRGTWASPGTPADLAPSTQLTDIRKLLDEYCPDDAGPIVLIGQCYGGLLAALAAAEDPRVTGVVALMPTRCFIWPDDYQLDRDPWYGAGTRMFQRHQGSEVRTFSVPHSVVDDALRFDLPAVLATLQVPILFVAGTYDELVGVIPVLKLHDGCGSPDRTFRELPVQHDYRDIHEQTERVNTEVITWIRQRFPAG